MRADVCVAVCVAVRLRAPLCATVCGCVPMCACPFGHDAGITLLIDRAVLACDFLLYSPGPPELTLEVPGSELPRLLKAQPNAQLEYS